MSAVTSGPHCPCSRGQRTHSVVRERILFTTTPYQSLAAFQPVTSGFPAYMQLRFKDKEPVYLTFVMVSAILGIIANLNIKFIAKIFGRKQVIIIGFFILCFLTTLVAFEIG